MTVSDSYLEFILEQLRRVAPVTHRRMFGGVGIYSEGTFFAIVDNDRLYFKVDDDNLIDFESRGMAPFRPFGEGAKPMGYYEVPIDVLEQQEELLAWTGKAIDVGRRARHSTAAR